MSSGRKYGRHLITWASAAERPVPGTVEQLEPRRLLSTYTVMNLNDAGAGSLRDAITIANAHSGPDIINFSAGLSGTILLSSPLEISDDLTLDGPGRNVLTISGNNATRVLLVQAVTARVEGLTIAGGHIGNNSVGGGAGIENFGDLTLADSTVSGNSAYIFRGGGDPGPAGNGHTSGTIASPESADAAGIDNEANLVVFDCTIDANSGVVGGDGGGSIAGGIGNGGTLTVSDSLISGNLGSRAVGGLENFAGTATISSSTLRDNVGGAIGNAGVVFVRNSTISGNSGPGIGNSGALTVAFSTVSGNFGAGGIVNSSPGALTITHSSVWGNAGGGILNCGTLLGDNTTIANNEGGGIDNEGSLTLAAVTISGNVSAEGFAGGGGVFNSGTATGAFAATVTITDSIVAGNSAGQPPVPDDIDPSAGAIDVTASGSNLIGSGGSGGLRNDVNGNIVGVPDPKLAILGDYGGPTLSMPPLAGSPAIDAGDSQYWGGNPATDQRGQPRVADGITTYIGAVQGTASISLPSSLIVTTLEDKYDGRFSPDDLSLREAIGIANYRAGAGERITFQPGLTGAIDLRLGGLLVTGDVSVVGPGAAEIEITGNGEVRPLDNLAMTVFDNEGALQLSGIRVDNATAAISAGTLIVSNCDVQDLVTWGTLAVTRSNIAGIVEQRGAVTVADSAISSAPDGLYLAASVGGGTFVATRCTVSGSDGAGVEGGPDARIMLTNCTIGGNQEVGILAGGPTTITNCTVSANGGGGISIAGGSVTLINSIVAGNLGATGEIVSGHVDLVNSRNNLVGARGSGGLVNGMNGNILAIDPKLSLLGDYGGPTMTMPPLPGSPAIDAGSNALAVAADGKPLVTDQRGDARDFNGTVDIGAVEYGSSPLTPGDANGDGKVNFADLLALAQNYGKAGGFTWSDGDFDEDGKVDFADLLLLAQNYGRGQAGRARPAPIFAQ